MIEQGTAEWRALRLGKLTASRLADATARTKTGWGASRANYIAELLVERLTGVPTEGYVNAAMQRGTELEPEARVAYEFYSGVTVEQCGFIDHPVIGMTGASPDGLVGQDGLVEIKCPNTATHLDTLLTGDVDRKYQTQMQWQMACTKRAWCDFVSYDPRVPEPMRLFTRRFLRNDTVIAALEKDVTEFLAELEAKLSALETKFDLRPANDLVNLLAAG